ncbi:MAG: hypothetical protein C0522_13830 [Rhodocyclaceae bacterium]|nr:hypothetical protein [Rhodocyclaceae bacterium]
MKSPEEIELAKELAARPAGTRVRIAGRVFRRHELGSFWIEELPQDQSGPAIPSTGVAELQMQLGGKHLELIEAAE